LLGTQGVPFADLGTGMGNTAKQPDGKAQAVVLIAEMMNR